VAAYGPSLGLLSKDANFRLIVSGQIGVKESERPIKKLELDKEIWPSNEGSNPGQHRRPFILRSNPSAQ